MYYCFNGKEFSYTLEEYLKPTTLAKIQDTFFKDYSDIKRFVKRIDVFVNIFDLPEGIKLDLDSLFKDSTFIKSDTGLIAKPKSLTKKQLNSFYLKLTI